MNSPLRGEVIAIGDELTTGQRLDTNTQWIAERLTAHGVRVVHHATVADHLEENVATFRAAVGRSDIAICTGGLGPTADDLTRDALAAAAGVELVDNAQALAHIESLFRTRGRDMPPRNALQARFPAGAHAIPNACGTAPGVDFEITRGSESCRFFALPGVPSEMRPMFESSVGPAIQAMAPGRVTRHYLMKCYGVGESQLEAMIPKLIARDHEPLVGITASQTTLTLRVTASGADEEACESAMAPTLAEMRGALGDLIFTEAAAGGEEPDLEHALVEKLSSRRESLTTLEGMTGGELARRLARIDPSCGVLREALVASPTTHDSESLVREADQRRIRCGVDWSIAIGAADNSGQEVPVALSSATDTLATTVTLYGPREHLAARVAKQALNQLRLEILREERGDRA